MLLSDAWLQRHQAVRFEWLHSIMVIGLFPTFIDTFRLGFGDTFKLAFLSQFSLKLSKDIKQIQEHFPYSVGCIYGLLSANQWYLLSFKYLTISCKSLIDLASLSIRVTTREAPARKNWSKLSSSFLPSRLVPETFSPRIISHLAFWSAVFWILKSWSDMLTRAYPYFILGGFEKPLFGLFSYNNINGLWF